VPKCIVHSAGGTLLKHLEEQRLQCDIKPDDRVFYFTTCGWMMWNWLVSALASEATLVLYDGSPFAPDPNVLFDYADDAGITFFGTSAKYIDALANLTDEGHMMISSGGAPMVGKQALELEFPKGASASAARAKNAPTSVITGPRGLSIAQGCRLMGLPRSTFYDVPATPADEAEIVAACARSATSSKPTAIVASAPRCATRGSSSTASGSAG